MITQYGKILNKSHKISTKGLLKSINVSMDYYQEATTLLSVLQEFLMFSLKIIQITKVSKKRYFCGFALLTYLSLYTIKFKDVP